jgi:hypothetical protein
VVKGLEEGDDFVFNCQMGRGRTTTGMIAASLIATIAGKSGTQGEGEEGVGEDEGEEGVAGEDEGLGTEADQYLNGGLRSLLWKVGS